MLNACITRFQINTNLTLVSYIFKKKKKTLIIGSVGIMIPTYSVVCNQTD